MACNLPWQQSARLFGTHILANAAGNVLSNVMEQSLGMALGCQTGGWDLSRAASCALMGALADAVNYRMLQVCFAAETKLVAPEGLKRIDESCKDDLLAAPNEHDPNGPIEFKL